MPTRVSSSRWSFRASAAASSSAPCRRAASCLPVAPGAAAVEGQHAALHGRVRRALTGRQQRGGHRRRSGLGAEAPPPPARHLPNAPRARCAGRACAGAARPWPGQLFLGDGLGGARAQHHALALRGAPGWPPGWRSTVRGRPASMAFSASVSVQRFAEAGLRGGEAGRRAGPEDFVEVDSRMRSRRARSPC